MEIKKCSRCGNFYMSIDDVCPNCIARDNLDLSIFKNFLANNSSETSITTISYKTGISHKTLTRFISYDDFKDYHFE